MASPAFTPAPRYLPAEDAADPERTLAAWLAEEVEVKARLDRGPGPGVARPDQVLPLTGLEMMQALLRGELPYAPIARTLDFSILRVEAGMALFQGTPGAGHLNPMGGIHGGWYATLLDSALGCAVHTVLPAGRGYATTDLAVKLVKGLTPRVPRVRAEGRVVHSGRQVVTAEAQLYGADGTLYAHASTTCLVFDLPGAKG